MRMNEIDYEAQPPIDGYGPGGFRIAGEWHDGALVVLPSGTQRFDGDLTGVVIETVTAEKDALDVVLVGMGGEIAPVPKALRAALDSAEVGVEAMSTPSACRTFNVLLTEGRRVAAILLPV